VRAAVENLYNRDMSTGQEQMNLDLSALSHRPALRHLLRRHAGRC
jgi:hypothetical protein